MSLLKPPVLQVLSWESTLEELEFAHVLHVQQENDGSLLNVVEPMRKVQSAAHRGCSRPYSFIVLVQAYSWLVAFFPLPHETKVMHFPNLKSSAIKLQETRKRRRKVSCKDVFGLAGQLCALPSNTQYGFWRLSLEKVQMWQMVEATFLYPPAWNFPWYGWVLAGSFMGNKESSYCPTPLPPSADKISKHTVRSTEVKNQNSLIWLEFLKGSGPKRLHSSS